MIVKITSIFQIFTLNKYYYFLGSSPARNVTSVRLTGSSGAPPEFDVDLDAIAANMQSRGKIRKLIKCGKMCIFWCTLLFRTKPFSMMHKVKIV